MMLSKYQYVQDNDGLVQDCGISIASAMEIPQPCTKPTDIECWAHGQAH